MKAALLHGVILITFIFTANAQSNIPKKSILLGGDLSFSSYNTKWDNHSQESTGFFISPSVGFAVKDNLFIGLNGGIGISKNSHNINSPYDSVSSHIYSYGVFARKYKPLKNNFYLFLQTNLGGYHAKSEFTQYTNGSYKEKYFSVNASLSPGISYGINSKLHIETGFNNIVGIGYSTQQYSTDPSVGAERKQTGFNMYTSLSNFNSQFYMGFRLLLQKNDKKMSSKQG